MNSTSVLEKPTIRDGFSSLGIFERDHEAWTTSRDLARVFEKRHDNVLSQIERVLSEVDEDFGRLNFKESTYKSRQNKRQRQYMMTRKGFSLIALGLTGKRALEFKVRYIEAFEVMSELIFARVHSKYGYREMSSAVARYLGGGRYAFAEEANRVNRVVLGMSASEFRESRSLNRKKSVRDVLPVETVERLDAAQRLNADLIHAGVHPDERTRILERRFGRRNG
jgi:Rha family phage regulatory protein